MKSKEVSVDDKEIARRLDYCKLIKYFCPMDDDSGQSCGKLFDSEKELRAHLLVYHDDPIKLSEIVAEYVAYQCRIDAGLMREFGETSYVMFHDWGI
jgi:hypothetical protein